MEKMEIKFGFAGQSIKDCPNKNNCTYSAEMPSDVTRSRKLCAVCTQLQKLNENIGLLLKERK